MNQTYRSDGCHEEARLLFIARMACDQKKSNNLETSIGKYRRRKPRRLPPQRYKYSAPMAIPRSFPGRFYRDAKFVKIVEGSSNVQKMTSLKTR